MDRHSAGNSKALKVQTCLKWQCDIPRSGCRTESEIFNCHGYDRRFRLLADANKPACFFLYLITVNSNGGMIPLEISVYLETPNELKFSSHASIKDPVYCIRTYPKEEIEMMRQRGWKSIPFVFVLETAELKSSSREYGITVYSSDSSDYESFANDIGKLLNNATTCDLFLDVDGERFPVHSAIICARGKKFEEKCRGIVVRQTPSVIEIDGVDKETFRDVVLPYIYNCKFSRNLQTPGFSERAYGAARILGLDQLANKCRNWFLKSLSPTNVYDLLILADSHKDEEFKETLIIYLFDQRIPLQDGWMDFAKKREAFELVFEIYHRFYVSHCSEHSCMRRE